MVQMFDSSVLHLPWLIQGRVRHFRSIFFKIDWFFRDRFSKNRLFHEKNDILIIDQFFEIFLSNPKRKKFSPFVKWATLILLFIVNLLNYMDRFTIVGVLSAVQQEFDIGQTKAALLQTVFLVSYMALSPIVGYLGKPHMQWLIAHFWFGLDFEIFRYR